MIEHRFYGSNGLSLIKMLCSHTLVIPRHQGSLYVGCFLRQHDIIFTWTRTQILLISFSLTFFLIKVSKKSRLQTNSSICSFNFNCRPRTRQIGKITLRLAQTKWARRIFNAANCSNIIFYLCIENLSRKLKHKSIRISLRPNTMRAYADKYFV